MNLCKPCDMNQSAIGLLGGSAATPGPDASAEDKAVQFGIPSSAPMSSLARFIESQFIINSDHRRTSGMDDRLLRAMRAREGEFSSDVLEEMRKIGISPEMYDKLTDTKCRAALSNMLDIFNAPTDKPWEVKSTPWPDIPKSAQMAAVEKAMAGAMQIAELTGQFPPPDVVFRATQEKMDEILNEQDEWAKDRARRMDKKCHDQLVEGGWLKAFGDYCNYVVTYGTGLVKGPFPRVCNMNKCVETKLGNLNFSTVLKEIPYVEAINPWDAYPSPQAREITDGYLCIRVRYTSDELHMYSSKVKGQRNEEGKWMPDTVRALLARYPNGGLKIDIQPHDLIRRQLEKDGMDNAYDCKLEGIEFYGQVRGTMLREMNILKTSGNKTIDPYDYYEVNAISIGGYVVFCKIIDPRIGRPISKGVFYEKPNSWWGGSIADELAMLQKMANTNVRNLVMNSAMSSGSMFWMNDASRMMDKSEDAFKVKPWKTFVFTASMMGQNGNPMGTINVESRIQDLIALLEWIEKKADARSGIPSLTYGVNLSGGAGRTVGGMSMLLDAANKGMKMVINTTDKSVVRNVIKMLVSYNLINDDDLSIKGDFEVNPSGVMGMILKEQESARRRAFIGLVVNPMLFPIVGAKGIAVILREEAKGMGLNPDDVIASASKLEEIEMIQQIQMLNSTMQNQPTPEPGAQMAPEGQPVEPGGQSQAVSQGMLPNSQAQAMMPPGGVAERNGAG